MLGVHCPARTSTLKGKASNPVRWAWATSQRRIAALLHETDCNLWQSLMSEEQHIVTNECFSQEVKTVEGLLNDAVTA